jgi:hypothetical protein
MERPEQLRILVVGSSQVLAVGGDELDRQQIVAHETELAVQPASATAQDQSADPGGGHPATGARQAVRLGHLIEVAHDGPTSHDGGAGLGIDRHRVHAPQVDHDAAVGECRTGHAVPAAPDRDF